AAAVLERAGRRPAPAGRAAVARLRRGGGASPTALHEGARLGLAARDARAARGRAGVRRARARRSALPGARPARAGALPRRDRPDVARDRRVVRVAGAVPRAGVREAL